jgi:phage head maturation protease
VDGGVFFRRAFHRFFCKNKVLEVNLKTAIEEAWKRVPAGLSGQMVLLGNERSARSARNKKSLVSAYVTRLLVGKMVEIVGVEPTTFPTSKSGRSSQLSGTPARRTRSARNKKSLVSGYVTRLIVGKVVEIVGVEPTTFPTSKSGRSSQLSGTPARRTRSARNKKSLVSGYVTRLIVGKVVEIVGVEPTTFPTSKSGRSSQLSDTPARRTRSARNKKSLVSGYVTRLLVGKVVEIVGVEPTTFPTSKSGRSSQLSGTPARRTRSARNKKSLVSAYVTRLLVGKVVEIVGVEPTTFPTSKSGRSSQLSGTPARRTRSARNKKSLVSGYVTRLIVGKVVEIVGVEPTTFPTSKSGRSSQLSDTPARRTRSARNKKSLVSGYVTRLIVGKVVEIVGVEPTTSCMPCKRSSQLSYTPFFSKWDKYTILSPNPQGLWGKKIKRNSDCCSPKKLWKPESLAIPCRLTCRFSQLLRFLCILWQRIPVYGKHYGSLIALSPFGVYVYPGVAG